LGGQLERSEAHHTQYKGILRAKTEETERETVVGAAREEMEGQELFNLYRKMPVIRGGGEEMMG